MSFYTQIYELEQRLEKIIKKKGESIQTHYLREDIEQLKRVAEI